MIFLPPRFSFVRTRPRKPRLLISPLLLVFPLFCCGCERRPDVVIYTSVDQQFAQQIFAAFEKKTGLRVAAVYDSEAGKTVGLMRRVEREAAQPQCDVWWSSEVFGTIELARAGLFEAYDSPSAADIPAGFRDPQLRWAGNAARARVLAYDSRRVEREELPATWRDLAEGKWAGRIAMANPQFGTTRGHMAACFAYWGEPAGRDFLKGLAENRVRLADGNSQAVALVLSGVVNVCMTDTDDVWVAQQGGPEGRVLNLVYPTIRPGGPPLWIPCTVGLVKGGPHPAAARKLIDFLLSAETERLLAQSDSRNVPVRAALRAELKLAGPAPEPAEYDRAADALPTAMERARDILLK